MSAQRPTKGSTGVVFNGVSSWIATGGASALDAFIHAHGQITVVSVMSDASAATAVPYCYGGTPNGSFYLVCNDVGGAGHCETVCQSAGQNYRSFTDDLSAVKVRAHSFDIAYAYGTVGAMLDGSPLTLVNGAQHAPVDTVFGNGLGFAIAAFSNGASLYWPGTVRGIAICAGNLTGAALDRIAANLAAACGISYAHSAIGNAPAIMASGDSLVVGYDGGGNVADPGPDFNGGWRVPLGTVLAAQAPAINRTQVGPYTTGSNLGAHDGVGGQQGAAVTDLRAQVSAFQPDIITVGWATNDVITGGLTAAQCATMTTARVNDALARRRSNAAIVIVGIPLVTSSSGAFTATCAAYNALIAGIASAAGGAANRVYAVDPNAGASLTIAADGIHWVDGSSGYTAVATAIAGPVTSACSA